MKYVALFRGVNVGGNNKLPMKALAKIFEEAGCESVESFIQSGNIVYGCQAKTAAKLPAQVCQQIEHQFGFKTSLIARDLPEMQKIAEANPYEDLERAHIAFLASQPTPEQMATLDPNRSVPDRFHMVGREIYLHLPNGVARSKLTNAYFDSKLKTVSTVRNWRTVLKLLAMMSA